MDRLKSQILTCLQTFARSGVSTRFRTSSAPCACKRINLDKILKRQTKTCACRRIISFDQIQISKRKLTISLRDTLVWHRGSEQSPQCIERTENIRIERRAENLKRKNSSALTRNNYTQGQSQTMLPKKRSMGQRKGV